jgi:hypothetical protein
MLNFDGFAITDERARSVRIIKIDLDCMSFFKWIMGVMAEMSRRVSTSK